MIPFRLPGFLIATVFGLVACSAPSTDDGAADGSENEIKSVRGVTASDRLHYLHTARFRVPNTEIRSKNLLVGPEGKGAFKFNEEIQCTFIEPTIEGELSGATQKFQCMVGDKPMRVKYMTGKPLESGGVYGEILGTRLLWALGFGADRIYPVRVTCKGCPESPWDAYKNFKKGGPKQGGERNDRRFAQAVVEQKFDASKIEEEGHDGQGFRFDEIAHAFPVEGGPSLAELDAFKLTAVFLKHADSKGTNQRLVCLPNGLGADGKCTRPLAMIQDLGATFGDGAKLGGRTLLAADPWLNQWNNGVWQDKRDCQGDLDPAGDGTLKDPRISEGGRKLLADLLTQLSDQQLRDLFTASRITERGERIIDGLRIRAATVDDWVGVFKKNVAEITSAKCPRP